MREDLVRKYGAQMGILNFRPKTGNGWMECKCPLAEWTHDSGGDSHPSFAIRADETGRSHYACQQCKHKGTLPMLAYQLFGFTGEEQYKALGHEMEQIEIHVVANSLPDWDEQYEDHGRVIQRNYVDEAKAFKNYHPAFFFKTCLNYMKTRGLRPITALKLNLRYHYNESRLLFPVYDRTFELRGFSGRDMTGQADLKVKDYSGLNKVELFLGEDVVFRERHTFKFVIICEGLIDYAKIRQAGFRNVLALLGSTLTKEKYEKLLDLNLPVVWFLDNDHGGEDCIYGPRDKTTDERNEAKGALTLLRPFVPQMIVNYPKKLNDPGSMNENQIIHAVRTARYSI